MGNATTYSNRDRFDLFQSIIKSKEYEMASKIKLSALVLLGSLAFAQTAFAANETVTMPHDQEIMWAGKVVYTAKKGEVWGITEVRPCKTDKSKECWVTVTVH
jgi:hypothetical protein